VDNLPVDLIAIKDGNTIILGAPSVAEGKQQLTMYPNPASNMLNIVATFPTNGMAEVTVTDLLGRTVAKELYHGAAGGEELISLDVSTLQTGVYIVVINRNGVLTTGKMVKE